MIREHANKYRGAGLCVLPAKRAEKYVAVGSWKKFQERLPTDAEIAAWFSNDHDALCLICGAVSGNLEVIDFDNQGELFNAWRGMIDADLLGRLVMERSPSGGYHVIYRCEVAVDGNLKLARRRTDKVRTLIETRGDGGLFLCSPTEGYELIQGDIAALPVLTESERNDLIMAGMDLNEYHPEEVKVPKRKSIIDGIRPGDDYAERGDIRPILTRHGWSLHRGGENEYWTRPGKDRGTSATLKGRVFYVHSTNADPFDGDKAYGPFAVYTLLEHGGDWKKAACALRDLGYGDPRETIDVSGVDLSKLLSSVPVMSRNGVPDPGPVPENLMIIPGFVADVMKFTLASAPYPNIPLAFCGAIALQSFLAGRRVRDSSDIRPNLYLLALAPSGCGKDFPRKVNSQVLHEINRIGAVADKLASGEGLQDMVAGQYSILLQCDEIDGVLRRINMDREARHEGIPNILLTLYTSANDNYALRVKAGQREPIVINQPHATMFGTAIPKYFYESLSSRMLTNGFFSRMMIIDVGKRGRGQQATSASAVPRSIVEAAQWWTDFRIVGHGNLAEQNPNPYVVPCTADADAEFHKMQRECDDRYSEASDNDDEVAATVWTRVFENCKKMALIYAVSENRHEPLIGLDAVRWSAEFTIHQARRMLYMADRHVFETPFNAECLRFMRLVNDNGGSMIHSQMLQKMKLKVRDMMEIVETLVARHEIRREPYEGKGRPGIVYIAT